MKVRFFIDKDQEVIIQKFIGKLTMNGWLKSVEAVWNHPDYRQDYKGIVDFRFCEVQMKPEEVRNLIDLLQKENEKALRARSVILVSEPLAAAFATMFSEKMNDVAPAEVVLTEEEVVRKMDVDEAIFQMVNSELAVETEILE